MTKAYIYLKYIKANHDDNVDSAVYVKNVYKGKIFRCNLKSIDTHKYFKITDSDVINWLIKISKTMTKAYIYLKYIKAKINPDIEDVLDADPTYEGDLVQYDTQDGTKHVVLIDCSEVITWLAENMQPETLDHI